VEKGERIIAVRKAWLWRLLKAVDGEHFRESIPEDAEISDLTYEPLTQTLLLTVSSISYTPRPSDGYPVSTTIVLGD
jgi:hypothetical protein